MELVKPAIGLVFWMLVSFGIILFILKKFAWKPILSALKSREESIQKALDEASSARLEMANFKNESERILKDAKIERDNIIKEARDAKDAMVAEAKSKAKEEAEKIMRTARETINNEKMAAVTELKNQVAVLSIQIAEKILKQELSSEDKRKALINNLLDEVKMN